MHNATLEHSWFGAPLTQESTSEPQEYDRLWHGFMTARATLGLVLMLLQVALYATGTIPNALLVAVGAVYFVGTLATKVMLKPRPLGGSFDSAWGVVVGADILAFSLLQVLQSSSVNYTPLFALPILLASVLGSLRLALGTAAGVTVLLLGGSLWAYLQSPQTATPYFVQAALSGAGYFVIAFLASQLSRRLAVEGKKARSSQLAATVQRQVNELVIESLSDGVIVADVHGGVRATNPAARQLLGSKSALRSFTFSLRDEPAWRPLYRLMQLSFGTGSSQQEGVTLRHVGHGPRSVLARTRLTEPLGPEGESLCVLFLQDQREVEARMRTEKLASMGRMSTAVAHEIRNPLSAITQANALLEEAISDPSLNKLTAMVSQNAKRLGKIVDDILDVSRVPLLGKARTRFALDLHESVQRICLDWATQSSKQRVVQTNFVQPSPIVSFDPEHLRRVLVNLLDNAHRYASGQANSIQVSDVSQDGQATAISIWSDGAPMDQSVERHLFEPFFSSESRSSGLGLYICRELCSAHGASIVYQRSTRTAPGVATDGNEFVITFLQTDLTSGTSLIPAVDPSRPVAL
jgi:two-component system, NtrC family, sensor histidine kinase PilS